MQNRKLIASNSEAKIYYGLDEAGREAVFKVSDNRFLLQSEAMMLDYLGPFVKVPKVFALEERELVMEYIPNDGSSTATTQIEIADTLAALHRNSADAFGFEVDTTIGAFRQPNTLMQSWVAF